MMVIVSILIFAGAWLLAVLSWFAMIADNRKVRKFEPSCFAQGHQIFAERRSLPIPGRHLRCKEPIDSIYSRFAFDKNGVCLIYLHRGPGDRFPPFPIRGEIRWKDGQAFVVGRIAKSPVSFLLAGLVAWTALGSIPTLDSWGIVQLAFGYAIIVGLPLFSIPMGRRRFNLALEEVRAVLTAPAA